MMSLSRGILFEIYKKSLLKFYRVKNDILIVRESSSFSSTL